MPENSRIAVLVALAALASVPAGAVTPRRLPLLGPAEAAGGTAAGVAVVEPAALRLAPRVREIPLRTERSQPQPFVWSLAADSLGRVYAGTGNEGIVFRVSPSGGVEEFFRAEEIEVTALAVDARDRVYVGACPPARIYRVDPDGAASLLAATGDRGILYRFAEDGEEEVLVDSDEPHIVSLASGPDGTMFAGTAGRGLVYRIPPSGGPQILYDSGTEEVSALARTADGTLFAALLE
ncbi:MAG: hypothetical protein HY509_01510, partial [Acidobacteria bacterium]|nr:hypothetical protein [Acidobacteriota bacterium]